MNEEKTENITEQRLQHKQFVEMVVVSVSTSMVCYQFHERTAPLKLPKVVINCNVISALNYCLPYFHKHLNVAKKLIVYCSVAKCSISNTWRVIV